MYTNRRKPIVEINVVPYIDVMLVLLVIFMVTVPIIQQGVNVDLPDVSAKSISTEGQQEPLVVTVDKDGRFFVQYGLNLSPPTMSVSSLLSQVRQILTDNQGVSVHVRGDDSVTYGRVIDAMVALQQAGAESIGLVTEPPPQ